MGVHVRPTKLVCVAMQTLWEKINQNEREDYKLAEKLGLLKATVEHSPLRSHFLSDEQRQKATIREGEIERRMVADLMPILQSGFVDMISEARKQKAFQRKYNRFDPVDFLVQYLYNSKRESKTALAEIPFVIKSLSEKPRKQLPLRQQLTDDQASLIIQKFYRGYRVRKNNDVQELRKWQEKYRKST